MAFLPQQQSMMPPQGMMPPPQGMMPQGMPPQGMMPQGMPPQGMPNPMVTAQTQMPFQQGMPNPMVTAQTRMPFQPAVSTGAAPSPQSWMPPPSSIPPVNRALAARQMPPQGMPPQGMPPQGSPPQGMPPQGMMPQQPPAAQMAASMAPPAQRFAYGGYAHGGKTHHDIAHLPIDQYLSQMIDKNPQASQTFNQLSDQLGDMPLEAINEFIRLIRMAMQNPQRYPEIRQAAIQDQMVDPEDMPEQYDEQLMQVMLSTLIGLRNAQTNKRKVKKAKGGLAAAAEELQKRGRRGDTILAHINPQEAAMLRAHGGAGTINPQTGLVEYLSWKSLWKDIKNTVKIVAPIALSFMVPAAAGWLASSAWGSAAITGLGLQAGGIGAAALSGAVAGAGLGAAGAAISGQNIGTGALIGGVLGGASQGLGQWAKSSAAADSAKAADAAKASQAAKADMLANPSANASVLPSTGQGAAGAATGAAAEGAGTMQSLSTAPKLGDALNMPSLSGAASSPSTAALEATKSLGTKAIEMGATAADKLQKFGTPALTAMASAPSAEIPQDIAKGMSQEQKDYFNKGIPVWDWDAIREAATAETNGNISAFMDAHMQDIMAGRYNKTSTSPSDAGGKTMNAARGGMAFAGGGALSKVAYLAQGSGSGRADTIDAKLSDGEYVIDAETVALLGDGSTKEGARRLDMMRQQLRQQKGKMLSKGKFSTAAKSPLAYLKGVK